MNNNISIKRHEGKYNNYFRYIINQPEIIKGINKDINETLSDFNDINDLIVDKKIFPLVLDINGTVIGFLCLDDIDWENRNCRLKGGIYEDCISSISYEQSSKCILELLNFCYNTLGLIRIWGYAAQDCFANTVLGSVLNKEGTTIDEKIIYYGSIVEE